jgi:pectate lyase
VQDHRFSNLIGGSDDDGGDAGHLKVTLYRNWWADNVRERMPRVRFGDVHVFNNYYSAADSNYAVGAGFESRLVLENNSFDGVEDPHIFIDATPTAEIVAQGNVYDARVSAFSGRETGQGAAFSPASSYAYELDAGIDVKILVTEGAGPR